MKFCYTDETGTCRGGGDDLLILMAGIYIDASKVSKYKKGFYRLRESIFDEYETVSGRRPQEIKTFCLYQGKDNWSSVNPEKRKRFLLDSINLLEQASAKVFVAGVNFESYVDTQTPLKECLSGEWQCLAAHIALQVQRENFTKSNKEQTLVIFDDHYGDIKNVYDFLQSHDIAHGFYADKVSRRKKELKSDEVMNKILDILAVDSKSSELNQLADIVAYVVRRHIELSVNNKEKYPGDASDIERLYRGVRSLLVCREDFWKNGGALFGEVSQDGIRRRLMEM